jgi:hypothetical protein
MEKSGRGRAGNWIGFCHVLLTIVLYFYLSYSSSSTLGLPKYKEKISLEEP